MAGRLGDGGGPGRLATFFPPIRPVGLSQTQVLQVGTGDARHQRVPVRRPRDVIHRSDQGSQYTSRAFGGRCREAGVRPSMGSVGDAYDNAMCESFFATLECELLDRRRFASQAQARMAVFTFIEGFYNPVRLHSAAAWTGRGS